jgi:hypothetical protein
VIMEILNCNLVQKPFWRLAAVIVTNVDPIQLAKVRTFYREVVFSKISSNAFGKSSVAILSTK